MKRLLIGLFILICGGFLLPSFSPVRAVDQCSGSYGSCKDYTCSVGGLCPSTAVCSGVFAGQDCCYNYGPYCLSSYQCGCSSDTCTGGVPATTASAACPCGCNTDGTCKICCLTSKCPCGCDPAIGNTSGGVGVCDTCCLASKTKGCTSINTSGGVEGNIYYFNLACRTNSTCTEGTGGPYAEIWKYFGCPTGSNQSDCEGRYMPGSYSAGNNSSKDSCAYLANGCTIGVCHPYTCVESRNSACVNTGGTQSWDGCAYSCSVCPPSASPSPSPGTCTAATGLSYTRDGITGVVDALSWTRGTGGTNQYLYVDDTLADVTAGCPVGEACSGPGCCAIKNTDLGTGATGYSDLSILEAGRLYYWRVVTYSAACQRASATALFVDSCLLDPTSIILSLDDPATPLRSQMYSSTDILRTDFSQTGGTVNLIPTSVNYPSYPYETSVEPLAVGAGTITGTAVLTGAVNDCADTINVSVLEPGPWWQAAGPRSG
jgi:hypothetical protein